MEDEVNEVKEEGKGSSHASRAVGPVKYPVTISFLWIYCILRVNVRHTIEDDNRRRVQGIPYILRGLGKVYCTSQGMLVPDVRVRLFQRQGPDFLLYL